MEYKEIVYNKQLILNGVNKLADCVLKTMGPNGGTVMLIDDFGRPYTTKDGVSVAKAITLENPVEEGAAMLVKQAAEETLRKVGDGTTTSICLAQAFITKSFKLLQENKYTVKELIKELDNLEKEAIEKLTLSSQKLNKDNTIDVARISANGDEKIAKLIAEAYENSDTVKVEETNREFDEVIKTKGATLNTSYFDPAFINNRFKQSIEYSGKIPVIIIDGHLKDLKKIRKVLDKVESLIIVADEFSKQVLSSFKQAYNEGNNIALIKSPSYATQRKLILEDLAKYLQCKVIPENLVVPAIEINSYIGYTQGFDSNKDRTIFYNPDFDSDIIVASLKEAYENEDNKISKDNLKKRIDAFSGTQSIIKVGGKSEAEIKERKDRIDDAVLAVKAALESGIVEGGGRALVNYYLESKNIYKDCVTEPYKLIHKPITKINKKNIFDFNLSDNYIKKNIIDPLKVTVTALSNAISVTKVIISTEAAVLAPRLWTK